MQKKIIALAIAGLASTAAFAQSNVTIYGSVDFGYAYRYNPTNSGAVDSQSALDGGQAQGNRLGFKGVEDLGNGLKAVFLLESGFFGDTGVDHTAGSMFSRQAYVGLTGGFGTLVGGRLYTPHFSFVGAIDPFSAGTVGRFNNVMGGAAGGDVVRVDNAVAYISPSFGGFTLTGAYSNNLLGQESAVDNSRNTSVYALLARYTAGPVDAGVSYHYAAGPSAGLPIAANALNSLQNITLAGTFDAKVVKVHALAAHNEGDFTLANTDTKIDNYMVGLSVPIGKTTLKGSYWFSDGNAAAGGNSQQFAVGANYALSKRTDLYTAFSMIDNDSANGNTPTVRRASVVGDASNGGNTFQEGFQVGVRHLF